MEDKELFSQLKAVGINVEESMKYLSDDMRHYKELLSVFIRDSEKKMALVKAKATRASLDEYMVLVHGLKSNARLLGMDELARLALWHESTAMSDNCEEIEKELPKLISVWEAYLRTINEVAGVELKKMSEGCRTSGNKELDISRFEALKEKVLLLIEQFEQEEAVNILMQLLEYRLDKKTESSIRTAISLLNDFSYDEALQVLS